MKTLQIDEKWSIEYDPTRNDRPTNWLRYGCNTRRFEENNAATAMFYALLKERTSPRAVESIVANLTKMERKWFTTTEWGSWLAEVGQDLAAKDLVKTSNGAFTLTPVGVEVSLFLKNQR